MANKNIKRISDLDLLTAITGSEEVALSYLTPHKIPVETKVTITPTNSTYWVVNKETGLNEIRFAYIISEEVTKWTIKQTDFESYKFPISALNGGNIVNVESYTSPDDFGFVSTENGEYVYFNDEFVKRNAVINDMELSYITNAQTFNQVIETASEENGFTTQITYVPLTDSWKNKGTYVLFNMAYITKSEMSYIIEDALSTRYDITGISYMTMYLDNGTNFTIHSINGSKGIDGERGWKGVDGDTGLSAFTYFTNANLDNAIPIVTDAINSEYANNKAISSAQLGFNIANTVRQHSEKFIQESEYASTYKENYTQDTNYYTFEEENITYTGKRYDISKYYTPKDITNPSTDSSDSSDSSSEEQGAALDID